MVEVTDAWVSLYRVVVRNKKLVVEECRFDTPVGASTVVFAQVPHNLSAVVGAYFFDLQTAQDSIMAVFKESVRRWNESLARKN